MKRWKIFHESDKQQNTQSKQGKSRIEGQASGQSKIHRKQYTPLRRSKAQSTGQVTNNKNVTVSQTFLPSYNLRYLKSHQTDSNQGNKVKTEYIDELSFKNDENPQKSFIDLGSQRLRQRKASSKSSNQIFNKLLNNNQLDTNYKINIPQIDHKNKKNLKVPLSFRKKSYYSHQKIQYLKKYVHILQNQHRKFKQSIKQSINKFNQQNFIDKNRWEQLLMRTEIKQKKNIPNQLINKILKDYTQYKSKIDNLQQQKQVFLQALIRITPV